MNQEPTVGEKTALRKWLIYLAVFLIAVAELHSWTMKMAESHPWLWAFAIASAIFAVIGIGKLAVDLYIRHARSIFE